MLDFWQPLIHHIHPATIMCRSSQDCIHRWRGGCWCFVEWSVVFHAAGGSSKTSVPPNLIFHEFSIIQPIILNLRGCESCNPVTYLHSVVPCWWAPDHMSIVDFLILKQTPALPNHFSSKKPMTPSLAVGF